MMLSTEVDNKSTIEKLLNQAIQAVQASGGLVWLYDPHAQLLRVILGATSWKNYIGATMKIGEGLVGRAFIACAPQFVPDYASWSERSELFLNDKIGPDLVLPLIWQEQVVGCLDLFRAPGAEPFGDEEVSKLGPWADELTTEIVKSTQFEDIASRAEYLERALIETGQILSAHQELGTMLNALADTAKQLLRADLADIQLYDPDADDLVSPSPETSGLRLPLMGLIGTVWSTRRPLSIYDIQEDRRNPEPTVGKRLGVRGFLGVPLIGQRRVVGVLSIATAEPRLFTQNDEKILTTFARYAAAAIENARLAQELQERLDDVRVAREETKSYARELAAVVRHEQARAQQLDALREISLQIAAQQDLAALFQMIVDATRRLLGAETVILALRRGELLENVASTIPAWLNRQYGPGDGLTGRVGHTGESMIVEDYAKFPDRVPLPEGAPPIADVAIVPLISREQIIGTLSASHTRADAGGHVPRLSKDDLLLLQHLAAQAAVAIESARLVEDLRSRLKLLDALATSALDVTSTLNYRELLDRIAARAQSLFNVDAAGITILYSSGELEFAADTGTGLAGQVVPPGKGLHGVAVQTGAPVIVNDYQNWEHRLPVPNVANLRAGMAVPLRVRNHVIGALDVLAFEGGSARTFDEADVKVLEQLAAYAAIAIENARLYGENLRELKTRSTWFQEAQRRMLASIRSTLDLLALQKQHADSLSVEQVIETTRAHLENLSTQPEFTGEEGSFVPLQALARALGSEVLAQHQRPGQNVDLIVDGDPLYLDLHQANILSLITRELVASALEHGLRDAPRGIIHITTRSARERAALSVEDDGAGDQEGRKLPLVERLVTQDLKGEFRLQPRRNQQGMQASVTWTVNGS